MQFIIRKKSNNKFSYLNSCSKDIERIKHLRIPPQWTDVKISKCPKNKIQATGYDSKFRKQYIYHPMWVSFSKQQKFNTMKKFSYVKYKSVINKFIALNDLSINCIICSMLKIMEETNIRVGNEIYLNENKSVGLTTLMKKNVVEKGDKIFLSFIGKKGIPHYKEITDTNSKKFIRKIKKTPGKFLFLLRDGKSVNSQDLNTFIKNYISPEITCKDIRTYSANKIFQKFMNKLKLPETEKERKKNITEGLKYTAEKLGNTPKVCRDSYISPDVLNLFS